MPNFTRLLSCNSLACIIILCALLSEALVGSAFIQPNSNTAVYRSRITQLNLKKGGTKKKHAKGRTITLNKLAYRNYEVLETLEVGIALRGTEVKRYDCCTMSLSKFTCNTLILMRWLLFRCANLTMNKV
jgi:hypothetical protein